MSRQSLQSSDDYDTQQVELYVKWVNSVFYDRPELRIGSLEELSDGVKLIRLMELLTSDVRRYHKHPFNLLFKNENCHTVIEWLAELGVEVKFITPNSIVLGDHRAIMSLLWAMKRHFADVSKGLPFISTVSKDSEVVSKDKYSDLNKNYMVAMLHNTYLEREIKRLMVILEEKSEAVVTKTEGNDIEEITPAVDVNIIQETVSVVNFEFQIEEGTKDSSTSEDAVPVNLIHNDLVRKDYANINIRNSSMTDIKTSKKSAIAEDPAIISESSSDLEIDTNSRTNWLKSSTSHFVKRPDYSYDSSEDLSDAKEIVEDISFFDEKNNEQVKELHIQNKELMSSEKRLTKKKNNLVEELMVATQKIENQANENKILRDENHELKEAVTRLERQLFDSEKRMVRKQKTLLRVIDQRRTLETKLKRKTVLTLDDYSITIQSYFRVINAKKDTETMLRRGQRLETLIKRYLAKTKLQRFKGFQYYCNELVSAEKTYLRQLRVLYNDFLLPLRDEDLIIPRDILDIILPCTDLEAIIRFNTSFLRKLEYIIPEQNFYTKICGTLEAIEKVPKIYSRYVSNYDHAITEFSKTKEKYEKFEDFCNEFESPGLSVPAFLIMPCQRVPRYYMTYKDILKFAGSDYSEYEQLENMVLLSQDIAHKVNTNKAIEDARYEVKSVLAKFSFLGWEPQPNPERRLYSLLDDVTCLIRKKKQKFTIALFSDLLIAGKASRTKILVHGDESLKFQKKVFFKATTKLFNVDDLTFEVGNKESIIIHFDNQPDCKQWFNYISESIATAKETRDDKSSDKKYSPILTIDAFFNSNQFLDLKQELVDDKEPRPSIKRRKKKESPKLRPKSSRIAREPRERKKSSTINITKIRRKNEITDDTEERKETSGRRRRDEDGSLKKESSTKKRKDSDKKESKRKKEEDEWSKSKKKKEDGKQFEGSKKKKEDSGSGKTLEDSKGRSRKKKRSPRESTPREIKNTNRRKRINELKIPRASSGAIKFDMSEIEDPNSDSADTL